MTTESDNNYLDEVRAELRALQNRHGKESWDSYLADHGGKEVSENKVNNTSKVKKRLLNNKLSQAGKVLLLSAVILLEVGTRYATAGEGSKAKMEQVNDSDPSRLEKLGGIISESAQTAKQYLKTAYIFMTEKHEHEDPELEAIKKRNEGKFKNLGEEDKLRLYMEGWNRDNIIHP